MTFEDNQWLTPDRPIARRTNMAENDLDFTSSFFNPLKALYTDGLQPPVPNVQIFNNINEYAQSLRSGNPVPKRRSQMDKPQGSISSVEGGIAQRLKNIADNKVRSRNRDPSRLKHLMKVKSKTDGIEEKVAMLEKTKKKPKQKNVLERMEGIQLLQNPENCLSGNICDLNVSTVATLITSNFHQFFEKFCWT